MIAWLKGRLKERRPEYLVLEVGGVGYRVFTSLNTFLALPERGEAVELFIHTAVREDAIHLYGFLEEAERSAFLALCGVSGVGPKLAIGILSGIAPDQLWLAVTGRDTARLKKVPGIGPKTAARLVVELEGKLPPPEEGAAALAGAAAPAASSRLDDALSALMNLGYPEAAARQTLEKTAAGLGEGASLEDLLRAALRGAAG